MVDTAQGYKYQLNIAVYFASILAKNETVKDYYVFYEVKEVKPFDDVVLAVQYNESEDFCLYFVQVKTGNVIKEIDKYIKGYNEIIQEKKWRVLQNISKINEGNIQFWYITCKKLRPQKIVFTEDSQIKDLNIVQHNYDDSALIIKEFKQSYKLRLKGNNTTTNQDFFDNFHIHQEQPNRDDIKCILSEMWKLHNPLHVIHHLDKYLTENKNNCFSKTDFEHELLRMRLSNYIVNPIRVIPFEKEPADAWIRLTLYNNVTIVKNEPYTKVCLFGCILQKISDIITVNKWNKCIHSEGKLTEEIKRKLFSREIFEPLTIKDLVIYFWMCNKIPLILEAENDLPALEEFSHLEKHYVIIDSQLEKRYDEMKHYNLRVIKDLEGVQADELLQSITVSMQGKKPTSLYEVINGDENLLKTLTCSDILELIKPRQVYLKKECFKESNNGLFIIETTNPQQISQENDKTIGSNVIKYCPPDQSDRCYQEASQNPNFNGYKIYRLYSQCSTNSEEKLSPTKDKTNVWEFDKKENIAENNSLEQYRGLQYFFVDQHGNSVYRENENKVVPILGEIINLSCPRYLPRYMSTSTIKYQETDSSIDNSYNSVIENNELPFCEKEFFNKTSRKICLIAGQSGIGKTTFLRSLPQTCHPQYYVLYCDLALYKRDLYDKRKQKSELCSDPLNFLCNNNNSLLPYSNFLSALKRNSSRLIIIFDSLDEVIATCKNNVLKVIEKLNQKHPLKKIIVGTRLLTIKLLSNKFDVDVVEIEGLNVEWNGDYVQDWNIDENYIRKMPNEFLKIPLYLNFLKTIAASNLDIGRLNRWNLYKTIINLKIDLYYERRNENPDETEINTILKYYYKLALKAFLPGHRITKKIDENKPEAYINFARVGIIKCFNNEKVPVFVHHTLLEFLISRWLIETLNKEDAKCIYEYILRNHMHDILYLHSEQFPLHKAVIDKDLTQVQNLCREKPHLLEEADGLGRTALHIAALESLIFKQTKPEITDIILQHTIKNQFNLYPRDKLLNWTWIDYCHTYRCHTIYDFYCLSDAILEAYWNFQYQVGSNSCCKFMDDYRFNTFCYRAFEIPSIQTIRILFLLKYYNNEDLAKINKLYLRSELTVAALPKSFMPELKTTLMHVGCINSSAKIVSACIERGDDINVKDNFGCTPLYYGVCGQNEEIVKLLLENGADMKLNPIDQRLTPLFEMSLRIQNKNIITMLINAMDKSLQGWDGSTPLHDALNYDNVEAVEMMLNAGANVNIPNEHGDTPLHFAVRYRNEHLVQLLLQYQANVNMTNKKGQTPLFDAVRAEGMELIHMLLNMDADVNTVDEEGNTLLDIAVNYSNDLVFQLLLQNRADINGINSMGETPLFRTRKFNDTRKMQILLDADANVNIKNVHGNTVLHIAIDSYSRSVVKNTEMIKMLLKANANVNIVNKWGDTPLHKAASAGFEDVVQLLLQYKADLYAKNYQHETPLFLAVLTEQTAIINILLNEEITIKNGADKKGKIYINTESQTGDTPLCCAIKAENVEIIKILLKHGADVNYVDKKRCHLTPLFTAVETQNKEIIEILLRKGANINFKSEYDVTPLYLAILLGNADIIELLMDHQADLDIVTSINTLLTKAKQIGDINGALGLLNIWAQRSPNSLTYVTYSNELKHCIQIVEKEADINLANEISLDREENNVELVHTLLKVAAEVTNPTPIGRECLNTIIKLNDEEIDRVLIQNFQEKYKEFEGLTDVEYAAIQGNRTMVEILLRNSKSRNNISLTRVIQRSQQKYPVQILLENQIDVNLPGENGDSPLLTALDCSTADVVEILLKNGAAVNGVNNRQPNRTPLRVAIRKSRLRSVRMLLKSGANINVENKPMLHSASKGKSTKIVHMLLEHGADPNQTDEYGQTALHHAVINNRQHIVKKLLEFNAAVNIADDNGLIPLDYVSGTDSDDIINMLRKH